MSNGGDSASTIAGKLAKYAYSPDSPRKLGSPSTVPATPTRPFRGSTSTPTPLRRSARKSTSRSPYFEADDDEGEDDSDEFEDLSDTPPTPSKTPKRRVESSPVKLGWKKPRGFAGPENPGQRSSRVGHHFAHPTNKFWRALHISGLTRRLLTAQEDVTLPKEYGYGMTNLVDRPTAEQAELSAQEMRLAVAPLVGKLVTLRPKVVCFVGKKIWDIFATVVGKPAKERERARAVEERKRQQEEQKVKLEAGKEAKVTMFTLQDGVVKMEPEEEQVEPRGEVKEETELDIKPEVGDAVGRLSAAVTPRKPKPKLEPFVELVSPRRATPSASGRSTPSTPKSKAAAIFDRPQRLRLVLPSGPDAKVDFTYFWVVPNTSGLERTPLSGVADYFSSLREFLGRVKSGAQLDENDFIDFTLDEVKAVVAAL